LCQGCQVKKRPYFAQKIVEIARFKVRISKKFKLGSDFAKIALKIYYFIQHPKRPKRSNGQIILFLANNF